MIDAGRQPVWQRFEKDGDLCRPGDHTWVAAFFESGRLAYWQCAGCGQTDRQIESLSERLDWIDGWVKSPPLLMARGPHPPASTRRWATPGGSILIEGDPSSIHFIGLEIPGLTEAHSYVRHAPNGETEAVYEPVRDRPWQYVDHYWLTRYQVMGEVLVRFESHCYQESTYETPHAGEPEQKTILSGLRLLPAE